MQLDAATIGSALAAIPADDREVWIRVGMSLKAALGEDGRGMFFEWSATSPKFDERSAMTAWRSFRPTAIGPGTLFHIATEYGWRRSADQARTIEAARARAIDRGRQEERRRRDDAKRAAAAAREALKNVVAGRHLYLAGKGFAAHAGLLLDGDLIVPMMRWPNRREIVGYQRISSDGRKLFQPRGMSSADAVHLIGGDPFRPGIRRWWVEGYATGLSVHAALALLYRQQDVVIVAFSAGGIRRMARHAPGVIIADHDRPDSHGRQAGIAAAQATGQPFWHPPSPGTDANDYHLSAGLPALAEALRDYI